MSIIESIKALITTKLPASHAERASILASKRDAIAAELADRRAEFAKTMARFDAESREALADLDLAEEARRNELHDAIAREWRQELAPLVAAWRGTLGVTQAEAIRVAFHRFDERCRLELGEGLYIHALAWSFADEFGAHSFSSLGFAVSDPFLGAVGRTLSQPLAFVDALREFSKAVESTAARSPVDSFGDEARLERDVARGCVVHSFAAKRGDRYRAEAKERHAARFAATYVRPELPKLERKAELITNPFRT